MSSIKNFAERISPRMPDRGIRRRGVVSGNEVPLEDLDAYVKHLSKVSNAVAAINRRYTHTDFLTLSTATAFDNWSAVDPQGLAYVYITAAGVVRLANLSNGGNTTTGITGQTNATKMIRTSNGHVVIYSTPDTKRLNTLGTSITSSWPLPLRDLIELPNGRVVVIRASNNDVICYSSISNASTNTGGTVAATTNAFGMLRSFGNSVYVVDEGSSGFVHYSANGGLSWSSVDKDDITESSIQKCAILNGVLWMMAAGLGTSWVVPFYPDGTYGEATTTIVQDENGITSGALDGSAWDAFETFGSVVVARSASSGDIHYSLDAIHWYLLSAACATQFFQVVGNKLFYSNDAATFVYSISGGV